MKVSYDPVLRGAIKGIGCIIPIVSLALGLHLLFGLEMVQSKVLYALTFGCNPTSPFCTPAQKVLTSIWVVGLGGVGAYWFAKGQDERTGFVVGFSLLFWIFQFLSVLLVALVDAFILPLFVISSAS